MLTPTLEGHVVVLVCAQPLSVRCAVALDHARHWLYRYRARATVAVAALLALVGVAWLLHPHGGGVQWPLAAAEKDRGTMPRWAFVAQPPGTALRRATRLDGLLVCRMQPRRACGTCWT